VFVGGALNEAVLDVDDGTLAATARREVAGLLGITGEPLFVRVVRYPRSMPQYHVGHADRAEAIERAVARLPGLRLAGGAYRGVGIADCVRSGEAAVDALLGGSSAESEGSGEPRS
jgi:protoporphyrinogen/coproporphyrinogen III oxidase